MRPFLFFLMLTVLAGADCRAEVIFSEDYDSTTPGWSCADATPSGWTSKAGCLGPTDGHYGGEIDAGGRSGNSLKLWRRNNTWNPAEDYTGYLNYQFTQAQWDANKYKELYTRYYMKIPIGWEVAQGPSQTFKLNRHYLGTVQGGQTGQFYFDIKNGSTMANSHFSFYMIGAGVRQTTETLGELGVIDGEWHCYEWRAKLSTGPDTNDGAIQFWLDGVLVYSDVNVDFNNATNEYITQVHAPGIGNLTDGTWNFPTGDWYAIEFDDYVLSTTYIGPANSQSSRASGTFSLTGN